eukprot:711595-Alexandrium_andersonii.AAC.1
MCPLRLIGRPSRSRLHSTSYPRARGMDLSHCWSGAFHSICELPIAAQLLHVRATHQCVAL